MKKKTEDPLTHVWFENDDGTITNYLDSEMHKRLKAVESPGFMIKAMRHRDGISQSELAEKLKARGIYASISFVSDLENNRRAISANIAKALAKIFKRPLEDFIQ